MSKEIENKLEEIINYIKESISYQNYLKSKELLEQRKDLIEIINEIKKLQKEIVKNPKNKNELDNKIKEKLEILNNDITYVQYSNYLEEVNNMLIIFENKLNKYFYDVFN